MAFLDWIKNRGKQQAVAPKPQTQENAKQLLTREHAEWKKSVPPVANMPPDILKETERLGARAIGIEQSAHESVRPAAPETAEGTTNQQPMRQNMVAQDNHAPELSPTSAQKGHPEAQKGAPVSEAPGRETPKPAPPKNPPATIPRRPPSWER